MGHHAALLIASGLVGFTTLSQASHTEYRVEARFLGRPSFQLPGKADEAAQKKLEATMKRGFAGSLDVRVYTSSDYTELPSILPDWGKTKVARRVNGWNDDTFFAVGSGRATLGDSASLARIIPLGQRLLLTGNGRPADVFASLRQAAAKKGGKSPVVFKEGIKEISWKGESFQEDIVFPGGRTKLAEFRLVDAKSLEIKRFHPDGRHLTTEKWTPTRDLPTSPPPDPIWDSWQVGGWVMDDRDPDQAMYKKWLGYGKEPASADSAPVKNTTFRLTWLAPGMAMMAGGLVFLAIFTFKRRPAPKG